MHASLAVSNNFPAIFTFRSRRGGGGGDHLEPEERERRDSDVSFVIITPYYCDYYPFGSFVASQAVAVTAFPFAFSRTTPFCLSNHHARIAAVSASRWLLA